MPLTRNLTQPLTRAITRSITQAGAGGAAAFSPASLFASGEQGAWYDPSDFSTMFQDSAGTTPVTAVEDPVGKILDKSGRGNHATQPTSGKRPKLSARKNWLLATTTLSTQSVTLLAAPHTLSFTGTGTLTLTGASTAGPLVGTGVSDRVSLTFTPSAGSVTFTVSGSVTLAQLEYGSVAGTYQRVTTSTNYDTAGFPHYLAFDGVDDYLITGSIDFTATDAMTIVSGIQKTIEIGARDICGLGATPYVSNGTFLLNAPAFSAPSLGYSSRGTASSSNNINNTAYKAPWTGVFTGQSDISDDQLIGRANGVQVFTAASNQGTGNYINDVLYIGGRAGTANFYSGGLYQLILRGANTTAPDLTSGETFTATKTGVTL